MRRCRQEISVPNNLSTAECMWSTPQNNDTMYSTGDIITVLDLELLLHYPYVHFWLTLSPILYDTPMMWHQLVSRYLYDLMYILVLNIYWWIHWIFVSLLCIYMWQIRLVPGLYTRGGWLEKNQMTSTKIIVSGELWFIEGGSFYGTFCLVVLMG